MSFKDYLKEQLNERSMIVKKIKILKERNNFLMGTAFCVIEENDGEKDFTVEFEAHKGYVAPSVQSHDNPSFSDPGMDAQIELYDYTPNFNLSKKEIQTLEDLIWEQFDNLND